MKTQLWQAVAAASLLVAPASFASVDQEQVQPKSYFSEQCKNPKSDEIAKTIKAILTKLSTEDCESARNSLSRAMDLSLTGAGLTDLSVLNEFKSFLAIDISHNNVTDFSFIKGMGKLKRIFADNNGIEDLSGMVAAGPQLTVLVLGNNKIKDLSPLTRLKDLRTLIAPNNQITGFDFSNLRKINVLNLNDNQIESVAAIGKQIRLMQVELRGNKISDISPLAEHSTIWMLDVDDNQLTSIDAVARMTSLMWMHAEGNQISDMSPLTGLENLAGVYLSRNKVSTITSFSSQNLSVLYLDNNTISDVTPLAAVEHLRTLTLANNQVANISALKDLAGVKLFTLDKNPLGTSEAKTADNCPADAASPAIASFCSNN